MACNNVRFLELAPWHYPIPVIPIPALEFKTTCRCPTLLHPPEPPVGLTPVNVNATGGLWASTLFTNTAACAVTLNATPCTIIQHVTYCTAILCVVCYTTMVCVIYYTIILCYTPPSLHMLYTTYVLHFTSISYVLGCYTVVLNNIQSYCMFYTVLSCHRLYILLTCFMLYTILIHTM